MRFIALAIGAALAGTPAPLPEASLQSPPPVKSLQPSESAEPPGPDVMRAIELRPDLCLSARCVTV